MPWSATCPMDERMRFVLEAREGWSSMTELCTRYGISRRVGYKWLSRYEEGGFSALQDRSRAPLRQAAETAPELVGKIVELRQRHPTWGPRKLRARLMAMAPDVEWPACSTIGAILKREGLVQGRRRRRRRSGAWKAARTIPDEPNRVWTADFKGEFRLGSGRLCYPLTIMDGCSRYLLECRALPSTAMAGTQVTFERAFRTYGLPEVIRTDNGVPFSTQAIAGLSKLAVWWIRLGIRLERTRRSHPEDNGAHERMHRTLKAEATRPARQSPALQQRAFDRFRKVYNEERPHEALGQEPPAQHYRNSDRPLPRALPRIEYPEHFQRRRISRHGQFRWRGATYFVSETLHRQEVGLELSSAGLWHLYFGPALLAELDDHDRVLRPVDRGLKPRRAHR
jgi:putative transposase